MLLRLTIRVLGSDLRTPSLPRSNTMKKSAGAIAADRCDGDGLEILSIGSLHTPSSPSDKKYWISSRGKDRYPYSVGYQAVRTHGDQTFRMEIRHGSTGFLFVVTPADGGCYSNQTPEMA